MVQLNNTQQVSNHGGAVPMIPSKLFRVVDLLEDRGPQFTIRERGRAIGANALVALSWAYTHGLVGVNLDRASLKWIRNGGKEQLILSADPDLTDSDMVFETIVEEV
jgi:hypothetical protein